MKFFKAEKGYGFVDCGDGVEIFVHINDYAENIDELVDGRRIRRPVRAMANLKL